MLRILHFNFGLKKLFEYDESSRFQFYIEKNCLGMLKVLDFNYVLEIYYVWNILRVLDFNFGLGCHQDGVEKQSNRPTPFHHARLS